MKLSVSEPVVAELQSINVVQSSCVKKKCHTLKITCSVTMATKPCYKLDLKSKDLMHFFLYPSSFSCPLTYSLTSAIVAFVAGVCNLCSELQIVPSFIIWRPISPQCKHASSKASQVTHLALQVAVFPLPDKSKAAIGLADEVPLDSL